MSDVHGGHSEAPRRLIHPPGHSPLKHGLHILGCNDVIEKSKLTIFWSKLAHNVRNFVLKHFCMFQVDIPINARVTDVQNLKKLHTFTLRQPPGCW